MIACSINLLTATRHYENMRREDKLRKKTRKEIVLEYIKFLKIMNLYSKFRYEWWKKPCINKCSSPYSLSFFYDKYYRSINRLMIDWYIQRFRYYKTIVFDRKKMCAIFKLNYNSVEADLLWLHLKDKHIANCIII